MSQSVTDKTLIELAVAGDRDALEQLLWRHFGELEHYITAKIPARAQKHFGADDILQTVFAQVFRSISGFEARGEGAFLAWLRVIADHRLIDALRRLDRGGTQQLSLRTADNDQSIQNLIELICCDEDSPSTLVASQEVVRAMQIALATLPGDQAEAVRLHCLEHRPIEEIAARWDRTEAAVRGLVHRGKQNLREALGRSSRWFSAR